MKVIVKCLTVVLLMNLLSCKQNHHQLSIANQNGTNNCLQLKEIIASHHINKILLTRPFGYHTDTSYFDLDSITHLYGERLFTLDNEKFQCIDIDSIVNINNGTLSINYQVAGYDNSGPFTQDFVSNYWETGNGYLLNKKLPSFKGYAYSGELVDLDSLVSNSKKTLLHFGWLSCKGCMVEQKEITQLIDKNPEITFVNITIDKATKLDLYLIDEGDYFKVKSPYSRLSERMIKPTLLDERDNIFEHFHLNGLFPVNFLVDQSGEVEKIGSLIEIFRSKQDSIEVFQVY